MLDFILKILLVSSLFGICVFFSELLFRLRVPALVVRKLTHILSALATIPIPLILSSSEAILMFLILIILNVISHKAKILKGIEHGLENSRGSIYFPIGALISYTVFVIFLDRAEAFAIGLFVLGFSDSLAGLVGVYLGKRKIQISKIQYKTIEGSLTFFLTTLIIYLIFYLTKTPNGAYTTVTHIIIIVISSVIVTIVELYNGHGKDNLYIPIVTSALYLLTT